MSNKDTTPVTRETIIDWIRAAAKEAGGKPPTLRQCLSRLKITQSRLYKLFNGWSKALHEAGVEFAMIGERVESKDLLADWGHVTRKLGQVPIKAAYNAHGKYTPKTFFNRFGLWAKARAAFEKFAKGKTEWADVLAICDATPKRGHRSYTRRLAPGRPEAKPIRGRPIYGEALQLPGLATVPVNESGVIFLFGMLAWRLGFQVESLRPAFPDCEAKRYIGHGHWQRVTIEFEHESRNFAIHAHPPDGCDLIICWEHNWANCPKNLEIIALKDELARLVSVGTAPAAPTA